MDPFQLLKQATAKVDIVIGSGTFSGLLLDYMKCANHVLKHLYSLDSNYIESPFKPDPEDIQPSLDFDVETHEDYV